MAAALRACRPCLCSASALLQTQLRLASTSTSSSDPPARRPRGRPPKSASKDGVAGAVPAALTPSISATPKEAAEQPAKKKRGQVKRSRGLQQAAPKTGELKQARLTSEIYDALPPGELRDAAKKAVPISGRPSLINMDTARDLVRAWGIDKLHDAVVLDIYTGVGAFSRACLELSNVKRVVSVDNMKRGGALLAEMETRHLGRFEHYLRDPFVWETYSDLIKEGVFDDVPTVPWSQEHPSFFVTAQLPNNHIGDQLWVQLITSAMHRAWMYRFGRFSTGYIGAANFFNKVLAQPGAPRHHKVAVIAEATSHLEATEVDMQPVEHHFNSLMSRSLFEPAAVKTTPRAEVEFEDFEAFEHVLTKMFVSLRNPWRSIMPSIAHGAGNLLPKIEASPKINFDPDRVPTELTMDEWYVIANAFQRWPFRPKYLYNTSDDGPIEDD